MTPHPKLADAWKKYIDLCAEGSRLHDEGNKLCAQAAKLYSEGYKNWENAVLQTHGNGIVMNFEMPWANSPVLKCTLSNGEVYTSDSYRLLSN